MIANNEIDQIEFQESIIDESDQHCFFYQALWSDQRISQKLSSNFDKLLTKDHILLNLPQDQSIDDYMSPDDLQILHNIVNNPKTNN